MSAYIALLRKDGRSDYSVEFPDLPGCVTAGKTLEEAREFAREALSLHLRGLAEDGEAIPAPSPLDSVVADSQNADAVAFLVDAPPRKSRAVPVTITVGEDLHEIVRAKAAEFGMSQSGLFATSVRHYLGLVPPAVAAQVLDRAGRPTRKATAKKIVRAAKKAAKKR